MSAMGDYLEDAIRNWFKGTGFPAATGNVDVALYTAAPSDSGGGTEVTGGSYARVAVAKAAGSWTSGAAGSGQISNTAAITFPTASASWGTVTHFAIFNGGTNDLLMWGALTASKAVGSGDVFQFAAGQLSLTFA